MKATDIVDKFKKILLSQTEEKVEEIEVKEEVLLAEDEVIEEVKDEVSEESPIEEVKEEDLYATKEELAKAIAEVKAMYDQVMESMSKEKSPEVPQELKAEEASKSEVKLSSQESEVEPIAHSPESNVEKNNVHLYGQNRPQTIMDKVLNRIS